METKYYNTRFESLKFAKLGNYWSFVDANTNGQIGAHYSSKIELLTDLYRFAEERGYNE